MSVTAYINPGQSTLINLSESLANDLSVLAAAKGVSLEECITDALMERVEEIEDRVLVMLSNDPEANELLSEEESSGFREWLRNKSKRRR
ncbi:hypothetical protein EZS27_019654 [termite gut metagenome]|uniref:CopG family transcriptional regulator n=1 Tax=termite gut metagenome TaxID=433724 RepID=A0A5J4RFS7_9ZZZZ